MTYLYDNQHYKPPAPVLPITVHVPGDNTKQMKIEALVDTGADITCFPRVLITVLGAECASSYDVYGIDRVSIGHFNSYFLEFEIAATKIIAEVIPVGNEPILGRNLINEFILQLHGPARKLDIISSDG